VSRSGCEQLVQLLHDGGESVEFLGAGYNWSARRLCLCFGRGSTVQRARQLLYGALQTAQYRRKVLPLSCAINRGAIGFIQWGDAAVQEEPDDNSCQGDRDGC
jgi:hypothetical protein